MTDWWQRNPFVDDYVREELEFYGFPRDKSLRVGDEGAVAVTWTTPFGRVNDYLNLRYRYRRDLQVPVMQIDDRTWMSLSPMELQSQHVPIGLARGVVGTAGLGMGHFAKRVLARPEVEALVVFELSAGVIRACKEIHGWDADRGTWPPKLIVVSGDVRKELADDLAWGPFDFFYMDVYSELLSAGTLDDLRRFGRSPKIRQYTFWGAERVWLDAWKHGLIDSSDLPKRVLGFLLLWAQTTIEAGGGESLEKLYAPLLDERRARAFLEAMRDE